jgi:hypothetical protein
MAVREQDWDFSALTAMFVNGTLQRSPEVSNTDGLIDVSASIMRRHGVQVEVLRTIDHDIATGVYPEHDRARVGRRRMAPDLGAGQGSADPGDRGSDPAG